MNLSSSYGQATYGQCSYGSLSSGGAPIIPLVPPASRTFDATDCEPILIKMTPADVLDFAFNWDNALETNELLSTSIWSETGITDTPQSIVGDLSIVWLSNVIAGNYYLVTNTITTSLDRTITANFTVEGVPYNMGCC